MSELRHGTTFGNVAFEVSKGPPLGKSSAARGVSTHAGGLGILFLGWMPLVRVSVSLVSHETFDILYIYVFVCVCMSV